MMILLLVISLSFLCCGISPQQNSPYSNPRAASPKAEIQSTAGVTRYILDKPSYTYVLESELGEISSLAYHKQNNTFLSNNDENGRFYELDPVNFKIANDIKFSKKGDYESIEVVGDEVMICKSNGTIYSYNTISKTTSKYKTELNSQNDVEGMCYIRDENILLLACKGQGLEQNKRKKKTKYVFAFSIENKKLETVPYLKIQDEDLVAYISNHYGNLSKSKIKKLEKKAQEFAPSGISIHPVTKEIYIISARGSSLIIFDKDKSFNSIHFLNNKTIPQPEGITFDEKGDLYISTEGQGFSGKIFKFKMAS